MKIQRLTTITALACAIFSLLIGCGGSGTSSGIHPTDVYIAGTVGTNAVYWKDGQETVLQGNASAYSIAVSGSDVYVGGSAEGPKGPVATIWKNGTATTLSSDTSQVNAIAVANGNVYAVGNDEVTNYAMLWTNGTPTQLLDGTGTPYPNIPNFTWANSIFVSGSDVYIAGFVQKYFQISGNSYWSSDAAVYWKNGVPVDLTQVTNQGPDIRAASIVISGSDVYVAGNIYPSTTASQAVYWKNGTQIPLDNASFKGSYSGSIAVSGSNVYVAGNMNNDVLGYWTNGTPTVFSNTGATQPTQIAINGTDVYVVGDSTEFTASGPSVATYWKNGTLIALTPISAQSHANAIVLALRQ